MPAQLVALTDGPDILVDKPILLLGRHPECDIQIESRKISRRHCCIAQVNDYLVVRDLDSTNGIRINGVRVVEGRLNAGDELTVGNHRYQVRWDDGGAPARPERPAAREGPRPARPPDKGRPAPRPLPRTEDEDAMLESCDEPVPLDDPDVPESPRVQARPPARPTKAIPEPATAPPARKEEDSSVILPDNLELMPGSGPNPGAPGPPPPAG